MSMHKNIPDRNVLDLRSQAQAGQVNQNTKQYGSKKAAIEKVSFLTSQTNFQKPRRHTIFANFAKKSHEGSSKSFFNKKVKKEHGDTNAGRTKKLKREYSFSTKKLVGFAVGAFIIAVTVFGVQAYTRATTTRGVVLGAATEGFNSLQLAKDALIANNQNEAHESLTTAIERFSYAQGQLETIHQQFGLLVALPGVKKSFETGQHAVAAGNEVAHLGSLVQKLFDSSLSGDARGYVTFMTTYHDLAPDIRSSLDTLSYHFQKIDVKKLPSDYQQQFTDLQMTFSDLNDVFTRLDKDFSVLYDVLGFSGEKDFLLLFQNNQELRPTGGFIGSVARVKFKQGSVSQLTVPKGGSYDISGQVKEKYKAPKPLQIVNPYFSFQDANWFPDFPTSARKILELYYDAGNENVDGIIAFTPDVLLSLLDLTGPIDLQTSSGVTVDTDNFLRVTRESIEQEKELQSTEPKKIIADMMPKLLEQALRLSPEKQFQFVSILDKSIQTKDLLMYAENAAVQNKIVAAGFSGALPQFETDDYLGLITTNIAGGKTDRVINQHIFLSTTLTNNTVEDSIQIIRQHQGLTADIFSGITNLAYMRAYVPLGSVLQDALDFYEVPNSWFLIPPKDTPVDQDLQFAEDNTVVQEKNGTRITQEFQHTVFGNWMRVAPETSSEATFTYSFPRQTNDDVWIVAVIHQPGQQNVSFTWSIDADRAIDHVVAPIQVESRIEGSHAEVSFDVTQDTVFGVVFR